MNSVTIVFPHQLFKESPALHKDRPVYLLEEFLLFKHYPFHKQKIAFHRASMRFYKDHFESKGFQVEYIDASKSYADVRKLLPELKARGIDQIHCTDPVDYWLEKRLMKEATKAAIEIKFYDSPLFLNRSDELSRFFKEDKKKYYQTSFYKQERQKRKILIDKEENPEGGKWTYDTENRKKYPAKKTPPAIQYPDVNDYYKEARLYVDKNFSKNLGTLSEQLLYPTTYKTTEEWLDQFLKNRFHEFGTYEDAIVADNSILHHSVLTPMMNVGLITPKEVINRSLEYARENDIPINSTEGFIRQIIGWREFIRGIYICRGSDQRTKNFW
ncbi:MAG: cryptochrome/photolyase family protein, partial [Flavobacteriaceae bacterium]|nr:cryptochrome/photolyase family protein [Flavobacteriaceae bacterium]